MKFYEFNDYEYYALILADDEENAMLGYQEVVADLSEEEKELSPDVISTEEAMTKFIKGNIEGCETEEEKVKEFHKMTSNFKEYVSSGTEQYLIFLVDGSLY